MGLNNCGGNVSFKEEVELKKILYFSETYMSVQLAKAYEKGCDDTAELILKEMEEVRYDCDLVSELVEKIKSYIKGAK